MDSHLSATFCLMFSFHVARLVLNVSHWTLLSSRFCFIRSKPAFMSLATLVPNSMSPSQKFCQISRPFSVCVKKYTRPPTTAVMAPTMSTRGLAATKPITLPRPENMPDSGPPASAASVKAAGISPNLLTIGSTFASSPRLVTTLPMVLPASTTPLKAIAVAMPVNSDATRSP